MKFVKIIKDEIISYTSDLLLQQQTAGLSLL